VSRIEIFPGMRVTIMGLGINGGGLASALFFAGRGASVTVTDLRKREALSGSIESLKDYPVRYVLERHEEKDFTGTDLVIKNPAVSPSSPFLKAAAARGIPVETDLSVFFALASNPIIAVTGTKGKSTTASAVHFGLRRVWPDAMLGGNITVSPLSFLSRLRPKDPVVLELSSWQLGDLKGHGLLKPAISVFTVILADHLDKYPGMDEYIEDKKAIFLEQDPGDKAVFNLDDPWQRDFPSQTRAEAYYYSSSTLPEGKAGGWFEGSAGKLRLGPESEIKTILSDTVVQGRHNRANLLAAGLALSLYGLKAEVIRKALSEFPGVEHRLEMFHTWKGARFYNDSAATIPHATVEAVKTLPAPLILIMGGTDKNMDFSPLAEVARKPKAIILLAGTATDKITRILDAEGASFLGPYGELAPAVEAAISRAGEGTSILFSPGCASFGMFLNEFDRGMKFKRAVRELTGST
jgi:UDP-N-acetylmuramoylalanine--D-glutamate ligase